MATEMARGKTLDEALKITRGDVAMELGGLPPKKMHCSNLAADALQAAIKDYRAKQGTLEEAAKDEGEDGGNGPEDCMTCCNTAHRCEAIVEEFKKSQKD